jgi:hypothetical protein
MKKRKIAAFPALFLLAACQLVGTQAAPNLPATQTEQALQDQVATVIAGTQAASLTQTAAAPTPTVTTGTLPLSQSILNSADLSELAELWSTASFEETTPVSDPLCLEGCISGVWVTPDGRARLHIQVFIIPTRDQAVTLLGDIRDSLERQGHRELAIPDFSTLPAEAWLVDNTSVPAERYTLYVRHNKAIIILGMSFQAFGEEQNVLFLTLIAERQIAKLEGSGY